MDPVHIPLQIAKSRVRALSFELQSLTLHAKKMDITRDLGRILRELRDEVVSLVVDFLQTTHPAQSRIWWCPTAEFSLLPLHVAGPYRKDQRNLSHLYISSYTPTLTTLIRAREHAPSDSVTNETRFLAIGQAKAIGESELVSVGSELAIVCQRIKGLTKFTRIEGPESCITRISEELSKNEWVHFACHGLPNPKQLFESAFAFHDGHFTIQHIMRCASELENPQFAGFRSVIGTMWAVDDDHTNKIMPMFYDVMMDGSGHLDHTRAAFALNETMNTLVDIPLDQRILYVHISA